MKKPLSYKRLQFLKLKLMASTILLVTASSMAQGFNKVTERRLPIFPNEKRMLLLGKINFLMGGAHDVNILRRGETRWIPAKLNMKVHHGDIIQTRAESCCEVRLLSGGVIRLSENTVFLFKKSQISNRRPPTHAGLSQAWTKISRLWKNNDRFIKLPTAVCSIRGFIYFAQLTAFHRRPN